jgi:hypothetical protein
MQRLEVSGAVRPIYGSLGVKRLIKKFMPLAAFSKLVHASVIADCVLAFMSISSAYAKNLNRLIKENKGIVPA